MMIIFYKLTIRHYNKNKKGIYIYIKQYSTKMIPLADHL